MGYYERQQQLWFTLLAVVVVTVCAIIIMGVWHAITMPPQTDIQKARDAFIDQCRASQKNSWSGSTIYGIPNTGSTNPKDWTCVMPN